METKICLIEPLLERVEEYGKTKFELLRLKAVYKTANVSSLLLSNMLFGVAVLVGIISLNIAVALWLGSLFGQNYYGFLTIALFYGIVSLLLYFFHPQIKTRINNSIVTQMLN